MTSFDSENENNIIEHFMVLFNEMYGFVQWIILILLFDWHL